MSTEAISDHQEDFAAFRIVESREGILVDLAHGTYVRRARDSRLVASPDGAGRIFVVVGRHGTVSGLSWNSLAAHWAFLALNEERGDPGEGSGKKR
jgi:hypothetical protein